jgi:ADP-ribosylglycohydrolase
MEVWKQMDANLQEVSPHAQEILFLTLAAMIYSDFEFQATIEFLVNYGRDNDTTSALAGSVLGAFHGFEQLPEYKTVVMEVALEVHGINLQELAKSITTQILSK